MNVKEYANKHGVSERYVQKLVKEGKIPGAFKSGNTWFIPEENEKKKMPPISSSFFTSAIENNYYVDKTLLIKDIIDSGPSVTLFARPRRFGKTFNMSMLKAFFEKREKSNLILFDGTKISKEKQYMSEQGRYPVIFLSFKQLKFDTFADTFKKLKQIVQDEISRLDPLYHLREDPFFSLDFDNVDLSSFLEKATRFLYEKTNMQSIIIIDEYDVPITQGHFHGYYNEIISLIRNMFSSGFKDNPYLKYGFLTGVYRVAKESVFSGMNNLYVDSPLSGKYGQYFGYTDDEVLSMLRYYGKEELFDRVKKQYDGYSFGSYSMYNPWSVNHFVFEGFVFDTFWGRTGSNEIIRDILDVSDESIVNSLEDLYKGRTLSMMINEGIIYPELRNHPTNVFSFLLYSGYLTAKKEEYGHSVWIPNEEIRSIFKSEILEGLSGVLSNNSIFMLQNVLLKKDGEAFKNMLNDFLLRSVSYFDGGNESFYHGLTLGLLLLLDETYEVTSNKEAGYGRYDICLKAKQAHYSDIIIEVKHADSAKNLQKEAETALDQIHKTKYYASLIEESRKPYLIGLSFNGKHASICDENLD